jgi:hypothetical protein
VNCLTCFSGRHKVNGKDLTTSQPLVSVMGGMKTIVAFLGGMWFYRLPSKEKATFSSSPEDLRRIHRHDLTTLPHSRFSRDAENHAGHVPIESLMKYCEMKHEVHNI